MKKNIVLFTALIALSTWVVAVAQKQSNSSTAAEHKVVTPADLQWGDPPPTLPRGGKMAVLSGDPGKPGLFTVRLKAPAGYRIPPHTHPTAELVTCISGKANIGMGEKFDESVGQELGPGSFVNLPADMAHFAFTKEESIVQIHAEGPFQIRYINPADDPSNVKK
jgi:quercetin dioxygenase-like cupin family protein